MTCHFNNKNEVKNSIKSITDLSSLLLTSRPSGLMQARKRKEWCSLINGFSPDLLWVQLWKNWARTHGKHLSVVQITASEIDKEGYFGSSGKKSKITLGQGKSEGNKWADWRSFSNVHSTLQRCRYICRIAQDREDINCQATSGDFQENMQGERYSVLWGETWRFIETLQKGSSKKGRCVWKSSKDLIDKEDNM